MENINSKSFTFIITMMQFVGWYPRKNHNPRLFAIQGYMLYFVFLVLFLILIIVDVVVRKDYDEMQIIFASETANYCFKVLPFLDETKRRNITRCINYFNSPDFIPKDDIEKKIAEQCVKLCQNITRIFIVGISSTVALYIVQPIVRDYELPLQIWLPYDPKSNPLIYSFSVCYISMAVVYDMCCTGLIDPLMGGLSYQAVAQLQILKHRLLHLEDSVDKTQPTSNERIRRNLKKCIEHHKEILRFINEYEDCFSRSIFSQTSGTTIILGFCCIAITKVPVASVEGIKYLMIFMAVSSQVLFYCFFGTLLYEENETLNTAIYGTKWYEYDVQTRRILIMFMERAKQPILLTAGKIIELTLDTFITVLKRSYSLVAVLNK